MNIIFIVLVPLVVAFFIAAMAKLAARIVRAGTLSWKHGFFLAGFIFTLSGVAQVLIRLSGVREMVPPLLIAVFGIVMCTGFAAWFLGLHIHTPGDGPAGTARGARVAVVMMVLGTVLTLPFMMLMPPPV